MYVHDRRCQSRFSRVQSDRQQRKKLRARWIGQVGVCRSPHSNPAHAKGERLIGQLQIYVGISYSFLVKRPTVPALGKDRYTTSELLRRRRTFQLSRKIAVLTVATVRWLE